jgi:protein-S-isoprenylcysteine O-methyltransferase Ste14
VTVAALAAYGVYLLVAFGLRTVIQVRRTGDTGFRGLSGRAGSAAWWAGVGFVSALLVGLTAPVAALAGVEPVGLLDRTPLHLAGTGLAVLGIALTLAAQLRMGTQWRVGVDEQERTELVTTGLFALVRNPVFTAMGLTGLGIALMVPNVIAVVGLAALVAALQLQVRIVEEPYLRRLHGAKYASYEAAVGRFLPGLGTA